MSALPWDVGFCNEISPLEDRAGKHCVDCLDCIRRAGNLGDTDLQFIVEAQDGLGFLGIVGRLYYESIEEKCNPSVPVLIARYP